MDSVGESEYSQCRVKISWGTAFLATLVSSPVATLTITAITAITTRRPPLITTHHSAWWGVTCLFLDVGCGDNFRWEVEPLAKIVYPGVCQGVVVVLPGKLGLDVASGIERLEGFDDIDILSVDILMLGEVEVLLGNKNTLCKTKK